MKGKILCLIIALMLIGVAPIMADSEFSVTYPENGAVILPTDSTVIVLSGVDADYVVIYLDGEEVAKVQDDDEISYSIEEGYSIGFHTVKAVGVKETEGSVSTFISEIGFTAALWEDREITNDDMFSAPSMEYFSYVSATGAKAERVSGNEGADDGAFAMMISEASENAISPYIWKSGISWTDSMTFEMDLYFSDYATLTFETKSNAGFANLFGDKVFGNSISYNSSNFPSDEWFKVKMEVDFTDLASNMWIGRYDESGNVNYTQVFTNYMQSSNITGAFQFKIQPRFPGGTPAGAYVGIDNFIINETKYTKGLGGLMYESDGEYINADENTVAAGSQKIKFTNASRYTSSDITNKISIYEDGVIKDVESAIIKDGILEITFVNPLFEGSNIDVILPDDILLSGDEYKTEFKFRTKPGEIKIENVLLTSGSEIIVTAHQLSEKSEAVANVYLSNLTDGEKTVMLILTQFENGRIYAIETVPVSLSPSTQNTLSEIPVTLSGGDAISIEIYVVENFVSSAPLTNIWKIE